METKAMLQNAKRIAGEVAALGTEVKNAALLEMADALLVHTEDILAANQKDMDAAKGIISDVMLDRLLLPDPVGRVIEETMPQEGLDIKKISVPIGVIAIIYESRPNVTADAAALTLKSGNVCVLRCGKEAHQSAAAIIQAMKEGLEKAGVNEAAINLVEDTSRESANELMTSPEYVDLLIPRGGAGLIRACVTNATVPCIETGTGICHVYVDKDADIEKAVKIINNAKTSRPSVCNAEEVLLVHKEVAGELLPRLKKVLVDERKESGLVPVELRLDDLAAQFIPGTPAKEQDFDTEFLDYILAVKCVSSVEEAVEHIRIHSTGHSDAIVTENAAAAETFTRFVDSAAVYVNASTRFTDGGEFGLGCEIGISTQKLHARGPMGLREMNTYKYVITGNGHIR